VEKNEPQASGGCGKESGEEKGKARERGKGGVQGNAPTGSHGVTPENAGIKGRRKCQLKQQCVAHQGTEHAAVTVSKVSWEIAPWAAGVGLKAVEKGHAMRALR